MAEKVKAVVGSLAKARQYVRHKGFGKDGWNDHQKFKFRSIDSLWPLISETLDHSGLVLIPSVEKYEHKHRETGKGVQFTSIVTTKYTLISTADGSEITSVFTGEAADTNGDKSMSKAHSMCVKYWAIAALQIPVEGQDDGDATVRAEEPEQPAPQRLDDSGAQLARLHDLMRAAGSLDELIALYKKGEAFIANRGLDSAHIEQLKKIATEVSATFKE